MLWLELALVLGVGFAVFALPRASSAAVTVSHISAPPPPPPATITIKEPGRGDLPPNPPPVVAPVLMSVDGNGGIKTVGSARSAQERKPPAQPINCGTVGVACVTEVQPGTSVRVRAQPAAGYVFAGWTSGCSGTNATCTVNAGTGKAVNARFARRPGKLTVQIKIRARIVSSFNQRSGRGTLILNGTINAPASLRVQLRRPGGSVLLTRRLRTSGGPFRLRALLKRGTLAGGVEFLPGGFVVSVRGAAGAVGAIGVPLQMRSIYVNPPAEGVVGKAYSSD